MPADPAHPTTRRARSWPVVERRTLILAVLAAAATATTLALRIAGADSVAIFAVAAVALGGLAGLVGEGTNQLGRHLGPGATGVLQSALGNLPELFVGIFALQAGLVAVVQAALIGSILANTLLVLGLAFFFGGLRHGTQRYSAGQTRMMAMLLVLAAAALVIPALATAPGAPDQGHARELSVVVSLVLLVVFATSIPFFIRWGSEGGAPSAAAVEAAEGSAWPIPAAVGTLVVAAAAAAFVSDWFVAALRPAMAALGMSETFAGLVVVAIAGNAVENVVGVQAAMRNQLDLAISLILNSSLQVALALTPALVLLSLVLGPAPLTLVVAPLLVGALAVSVVLAALVVIDGESTWLEGLALIGLYVIVAASVWWGPGIGR
ncbi:MAG TPA: calcium/proton exchanger [Candidatus Acidoferrales bacterium]|nr:calcium/proton exchanger [Candidatus Acidoferrales bacterium]